MSYHPSRPRKVVEYIRANGRIPFRRWLEGLDSLAHAKVLVAIKRLCGGNTSNVKWFAGIGKLVIDWGPGYRVYLAEDGEDLIVLFGGGTKHSQQTDIARALALHAEYRSRKQEQPWR